jgi:hypothetical protein
MKPQELTIGQKAKSILLERGWRQGPYGSPNDLSLMRVGMVEALSYAARAARGVPLAANRCLHGRNGPASRLQDHARGDRVERRAGPHL